MTGEAVLLALAISFALVAAALVVGAFLLLKAKDAAYERALREQFSNLAAQTLRVQSGDLTKTNAEQLEGALKPLREQIDVPVNETLIVELYSK